MGILSSVRAWLSGEARCDHCGRVVPASGIRWQGMAFCNREHHDLSVRAAR